MPSIGPREMIDIRVESSLSKTFSDRIVCSRVGDEGFRDMTLT